MIQQVSFRHLMRLTDDVGLLEHANHLIPRRQEGYTTDDNARALWCVLWWLEILPQGPLAERLHRLAETYLAFLHWNQLENGHFYNNIDYTRNREPEIPSDDCLGRALWALAFASIHASHEAHRQLARQMFWKALPQAGRLTYARGCAYALAACVQVACQSNHTSPAAEQNEPTGENENSKIRDQLNPLIQQLTDKLVSMYEQSASPGWNWFEPALTYSNGLLPWALLVSGNYLQDQKALQIGMDSLDFLLTKMRHPAHGYIQPIGNRGWCTRESCSQWDQQPVDVLKLALAAAKAHELSGKHEYRQVVIQCRQWFYGENRLGKMMCLPGEGAGLDGLNPDGPNPNAGAESTLSFLLTERIFCEHMIQSQKGHSYNIEAAAEAVWITSGVTEPQPLVARTS